MRKKSTTLSPLKRPSTRSISINKTQPESDKYAFQSDDEDHKKKTVFERKTNTPLSLKRSRGRPPKTPKLEENPSRASVSSSNIESDSGTEESSQAKKTPGKYSYDKPNTRRASRLISQTNTSIGDKFSTPKKRGRKPKMLNTIDNDQQEQDKSKQQQQQQQQPEQQQQLETENIIPPSSVKRRYVKKKTLSTDTNPKTDLTEVDDDNNNQKLSTIDEKDLMQFGSPQHQLQSQSQSQQQQQQSEDEFSDDSVDFVWKGSSKLSIEILKRRIPKEESRDYSSTQPDPTAQRKRAIIPRLTNFDALSGQPVDNTSSTKRPVNDNAEQNVQKKSTSVITLNNVFQNDFVPSYNDTGTKMTTTTTTTMTPTTTEEKPRPRIYAVKSTTMKARPQQQQQQSQHQQQQQQPEIKRPKWMNDHPEKSEEEEDEDNLPPAGEEPTDYDYIPKGQYIPKRPNYRGRGTYPGRRGTGMRGRPPGSRRQYHDDDDDDDYDQYEELNSRYGARKQTAYRTSRPMYDMGGDDDDYDDRNRRMSLTQAYRRTSNTTVRPPLSSMSGQRRIAINNGNHPIYKPFKSSSYRPTPATLGLSTSSRRTSSTSRSPVSTISKPHQHLSSTMSKNYSDEDYYHQQQTRPTTMNNSNNTYVTKMNDTQLNDVSNQSQIFFVNMPQQEQQKNQTQQVLSVLTTDQQQQQQVLPVTVVQQVKLPTDVPKQKKILPKPSSTGNQQMNTSNDQSLMNNKPFAWSRPPARIQSNHNEQMINKNLNSTSINTDLDTMEAAHVLATAADVTMAADARRKAQQHDDDMTMMVEETPSNIAGEETIQCDENTAKVLAQQQLGTITANIIDENGVEHTVLLSTEEAQQLLGTQGAIIVDSDGQQISIQQAQPQTFVSPFALDQAQLQALLAQAGIDPNTPLTIEQVDPNQQQQIATLCTSPGGTQYTVLTQGSTQQQFILQTTNEPTLPILPVQPQPIAPKEELSSPPTKRRAFAVKSTVRSETFDDVNDRPRRKIFATKSTVTSMNDDIHDDQEGFIGTRAYHRNTGRK